MDSKYTGVTEQIEYGLDSVDPDRRMEVNLRDLLYVHKTLAEIVAFFHQPDHLKTLEDVERFMGDWTSGALHNVKESYYHKLQEMLPEDIEEAFQEGLFDNPIPPYYHAVDSASAFASLKSDAGREDTSL